LFLDFPSGSAVFQKCDIIGEAWIQPQAALQRNFILRQTPPEAGEHNPPSAAEPQQQPLTRVIA
jgi:hypothetical protein